MDTFKILQFPDPKLFVKCKPVTEFGPELATVLESMWETMIQAAGMGLSANQCGLDQAFFVMEGPDEEKLFMVNPRIVKRSSILSSRKEGCLSSPDDYVKIARPRWAEIEYQDEKGEVHTRFFSEIYARCIIHETEHLMGKSFLQHEDVPGEVRERWGLK